MLIQLIKKVCGCRRLEVVCILRTALEQLDTAAQETALRKHGIDLKNNLADSIAQVVQAFVQLCYGFHELSIMRVHVGYEQKRGGCGRGNDLTAQQIRVPRRSRCTRARSKVLKKPLASEASFSLR